jgi:phospholipase C
VAAAAIAALVTVQLAGADAHQGRPGGDVQHIFVIVLENHSQQRVIGDLPRLAYAADTAQVTPMTEFFTP